MLSWTKVYQHNFDFILDCRKTKEITLSAIDAAVHTVDHIHKNYPPPYTVFASGGIDSQATIYAWLLSGKEFKIKSAVYNLNLNADDLETLEKFSKLHNLTVDYFDFDLFSFLNKDYEDYVLKYRCGSPHICTHMKLSEEISEGTAIFSGNFISTSITNFLDKNTFGLYKFGLWSNKSIVPYFLLETEELAYGFRDISDKTLDAYDAKIALYQYNNFPVIPQSVKMTGFESVKIYYDQHFADRVTVQDKLCRSNGFHSKRVFDLLHRNKYESKFVTDRFQVRYDR